MQNSAVTRESEAPDVARCIKHIMYVLYLVSCIISYVFDLVCLFVCLSVFLCVGLNKITQGTTFVNYFYKASLETRNERLHVGDDLHSGSGRILISVLLLLFAICATLLLFAWCQHYNADDFSDEPDFNTVYQFKT